MLFFKVILKWYNREVSETKNLHVPGMKIILWKWASFSILWADYYHIDNPAWFKPPQSPYTRQGNLGSIIGHPHMTSTFANNLDIPQRITGKPYYLFNERCNSSILSLGLEDPYNTRMS